MNASDLGLRIREARLRAGVTQGAIAARLGVSKQQASAWERGYRNISAVQLLDLAAFCGLTIIEFFSLDVSFVEHSEPCVTASAKERAACSRVDPLAGFLQSVDSRFPSLGSSLGGLS